MSRHKFKGEVTLEGVSASTGNALVVTNSTPVTQLTVANQGRVTLSQDLSAPTQTNGTAVIRVGTSNASLVLAPNGSGALIAAIPDGNPTGGNSRGQYAVDLQMQRSANTEIAAGINSSIIAGQNNRVTATSTHSFIGSGLNNITNALYSSITGGFYALTSLYGQNAGGSGVFNSNGDAQRSAITYRRSITGTAAQELFLDGASVRAILTIGGFTAGNARAWRAQIDLVAVVQTAGTGTLTLGETYVGTYFLGIKNIGGTTSLIGSGVTAAFEEWDTNMATSIVTIDADDTTDALRIRFTPPTGGTSSATSVIRVVATAYLTEVGY